MLPKQAWYRTRVKAVSTSQRGIQISYGVYEQIDIPGCKALADATGGVGPAAINPVVTIAPKFDCLVGSGRSVIERIAAARRSAVDISGFDAVDDVQSQEPAEIRAVGIETREGGSAGIWTIDSGVQMLTGGIPKQRFTGFKISKEAGSIDITRAIIGRRGNVNKNQRIAGIGESGGHEMRVCHVAGAAAGDTLSIVGERTGPGEIISRIDQIHAQNGRVAADAADERFE